MYVQIVQKGRKEEKTKTGDKKRGDLDQKRIKKEKGKEREKERKREKVKRKQQKVDANWQK